MNRPSTGCRAWLAILFAALAVLTVVDMPLLDDLPLRALCALAVTAGVIGLAVSAVASRRGIFAIASIYTAVFVVFHFGLAAAHAAGYDVVAARGLPWLYDWFFTPAARTALAFCVSGSAALAAGICLQSALDVRDGPGPVLEPETRAPYSAAGFALLAGSILAWGAMVVSSGGAGILVGAYVAFLDATGNAPLMYAYLGMGIGAALLAAGPPDRWRRAGLILFAAWALLVFPLGLRGEVLFPACGALAVASMRRPPLRARWTALIALALLVAISVVRVLRTSGLDGGADISGAGNPFDALAELGSSLRPVVESVGWAAGGERALGGASYWAPLERLLHYLAPLWERAPGLEDPRLLNVVVQERIGPIGFSPVAEAFHNFRDWGPAGVMFVTGNLLGWLDRRRPTARNQALTAVLIVPLLIQIRNAFTQVPGQILTGLAVVMLVAAAGSLIRRWSAPGRPDVSAE